MSGDLDPASDDDAILDFSDQRTPVVIVTRRLNESFDVPLMTLRIGPSSMPIVLRARNPRKREDL